MNRVAPCHDCGLEQVQWTEGRNGVWRHEGGESSCRFPCVQKCKHLDCAEARGGTKALIRLANRLGIVVHDDDGTVLNPPPPLTEAEAKEDEMKRTKKSNSKKSASKKSASKKRTKVVRARKKADLPTSKYCPECDKTRKADNFYTFKRTDAEGKTFYVLSTYCKRCYIEKNKAWKKSQAS